MKKIISIVSLPLLFVSAASALSPVYFPARHDGVLGAELRYKTQQTATSKTHNGSRIELLGGSFDDRFDFTYGLSDRLAFHVARTPINGVYNLVEGSNNYDSYGSQMPSFGVIYRVKDDGFKLDLFGDWGPMSRHVSRSDWNSGYKITKGYPNVYHVAARIGKEGDKASYSGTVGILYKGLRTDKAVGWTTFNYVDKWKTRLDYYLKLDGLYSMSKRFDLRGDFVLSQFGEQKRTRTGFGATEQTYNKYQDPEFYLEVGGDYKLKDNVLISPFLGYTPETKTGDNYDNNDYINFGARFAVKF